MKVISLKENYSDLFSVLSFLLFSSLVASLNSLMPEPNPFISSGIFLPPNNNSKTTAISIISVAPNLPIILWIYSGLLFCELFFVFSSLVASLNSLMPEPKPFMSSGIFLPPKSNSTTTRIINIFVQLGMPKIINEFIIIFIYVVQRYDK